MGYITCVILGLIVHPFFYCILVSNSISLFRAPKKAIYINAFVFGLVIRRDLQRRNTTKRDQLSDP